MYSITLRRHNGSFWYVNEGGSIWLCGDGIKSFFNKRNIARDITIKVYQKKPKVTAKRGILENYRDFICPRCRLRVNTHKLEWDTSDYLQSVFKLKDEAKKTIWIKLIQHKEK